MLAWRDGYYHEVERCAWYDPSGKILPPKSESPGHAEPGFRIYLTPDAGCRRGWGVA